MKAIVYKHLKNQSFMTAITIDLSWGLIQVIVVRVAEINAE